MSQNHTQENGTGIVLTKTVWDVRGNEQILGVNKRINWQLAWCLCQKHQSPEQQHMWDSIGTRIGEDTHTFPKPSDRAFISIWDASLLNVLSFGMSTHILLIEGTMTAVQCQDVSVSPDLLCFWTQGESEVRPLRAEVQQKKRRFNCQ